MSSEPLNDSRPRWAALCRRPDAHPEVDHDSRLRCDCLCHGPDGALWTARTEPLADSMSDEDVESLARAVGIHPRHVRFIVDRAEQRIREQLRQANDAE